MKPLVKGDNDPRLQLEVTTEQQRQWHRQENASWTELLIVCLL